MKPLVFGYIVLFLILASCKESPEQRARQTGKEIYFEEQLHDYGEIAMHSDGIYKFTFKNLSENPIIINRVRSSCGCTVPSWPREPIEPGAEGEIIVKYNTELAGSFQKSIFVYSTASNSPVKLQIKGKVTPEKDNPDA